MQIISFQLSKAFSAMLMDEVSVENTLADCTNEITNKSSSSTSGSTESQNIVVPVIRQIERNAENYPDKVALLYGGEKISYALMIATARKIAAGLAHFGAVPGSRVSVLMHPSPELVCSLLGIHMLGATYVPIDPGFPSARIQMILEDIEAAAIICADSNLIQLKSKLSSSSSDFLHSVSDIKQVGELSEHGFKAYPTTLEDESHIFFTSGTTGRPKGAISSQRNLTHGMSSSAQCFELKSDHGILSVAGSSFSISTFELLSLLTCGGFTAIAERSEVLSIDRLFEAAKQVSVLHLVPTLLARLIDFAEQAPDRILALSSIQRILTGGDNVPPGLLQKIRDLLPETKLYVNYGASETNCMVTYWPVTERFIEKTKIGVPQKNVRLQVLDKARSPVTPGNVGELFVASPGVILGYIKRDDLNAQKFFIEGGHRYFATGDMVRTDHNGVYEMLGREDFQIQLNGNRIELLEVEAILRRINGIKDCVVAALKNNPEENASVLAAYVVLSGSTAPSVTDIKAFMREHVPDYMVPSLFLLIDAIPTNHNGKVDRVNLPDPSSCGIIQSNPEEPLVAPIEQCIASIWTEVLTIPATHRNSDFFELGGDSIKAVQAVAKISSKIRCSITIADLISNTTVKTLAEAISNRLDRNNANKDTIDNTSNSSILLKEGSSELSPILLLNGVVEYLELAKALQTNRAIYAIYLPEEVDLIVNGASSTATTSTGSITSITELYLSVIKKLQPAGPYILVGKSFGGIIAIEVSRELEKSGHEVQFIGLLDTVVPDAFTAHRRLTFRLAEHLKHTLHNGPRYLLSRLSKRYLTGFSINHDSSRTKLPENDLNNNIRVRHKVRKNAIFNTRISPINRPIVLIKARDRKYLYGERPSKDLGWSKYCNEVTVSEVPGDHHSILSVDHVSNVARKLEPYFQ